MDFAIADLEKNKKALAEKQALFLAPLVRLELTTPRLTAACSGKRSIVQGNNNRLTVNRN